MQRVLRCPEALDTGITLSDLYTVAIAAKAHSGQKSNTRQLAAQMRVQDVIIWSRKQYRSRPRLCRSDGKIMSFRAYCAQFYTNPNA